MTEREGARSFTWKERLRLTLFLAPVAPLTICLFGPATIFASNASELQFVLGDFIWWDLLMALGATILFAGILLPLRGRAFEAAYAFLLFASLALFLQGSYLNFGVGAVDGEERHFAIASVVLNAIVWAVLAALCVGGVLLFTRQHCGVVKAASLIVCVTILGVQCVTLLSYAVTGRHVFQTHDQKVRSDSFTQCLTYRNLGTVSAHRNVVYFLIDRWDMRYCRQSEKEDPDFFRGYDGFTLYEDAMSLYPRTFPSVVYMLSEKERDPHLTRAEYMDDSFRNSVFLKTLNENGYNVNLYTDKFYVYENAASMREYIQNALPAEDYTVRNSASLAVTMAGLSLYRFAPLFAKSWIPVTTGAAASEIELKTSEVERMYTTDMRQLYLKLTERPFTTYEDDRNHFSFIHLWGTHTPGRYDENLNPLAHASVQVSAKASFRVIRTYLDEMKRLGVYKDATIIITADHCAIDNNYELPTRPQRIPILFKRSGDGENRPSDATVTRSSAPVAHANIIPSIMASEGLPAIDSIRPLSDIREDEILTRKYLFQRQGDVNGKRDYEEVEYAVTGPAWDFNNWKIVRRSRVGDIYR